MNVDREFIKKVASTAKISLTEKEINEFIPQVQEILKAFQKISTIDTKSVKPSFHPIEIRNRLRDDITGNCLTQEEALSLTPHKKEGYFKGPKVV